MMFQIGTIRAFTIFRISFGLVWVIDGAMKFFMQPSDVVNLVTNAGSEQPGWLSGWFSFWISTVTNASSSFLYGVGLLELTLGIALILGLLRKPAYFAGILLSLMIWAVDEGFGGPYAPGSTDIGAAIMYVFVFVALVILERSENYDKYSLDGRIASKWNAWRIISSLHG